MSRPDSLTPGDGNTSQMYALSNVGGPGDCPAATRGHTSSTTGAFADDASVMTAPHRVLLHASRARSEPHLQILDGVHQLSQSSQGLGYNKSFQTDLSDDLDKDEAYKVKPSLTDLLRVTQVIMNT